MSVALLVVGGFALGLLGCETLRRFAPVAWNAPGAAAEGGVPALDPVDLGALSPPDRFELALAALFALLRLLLPLGRSRRLLEPLVDLPLLGVLIAVSGGALSPLDPTLPLVYLAALVFLRGAESGSATPRRLTVELLVGLAAIHLIVARHDQRRLDDGAAEQLARLQAAVAATRSEFDAALASVEEPLRAQRDPAGIASLLPGAGLAAADLAAFDELGARLLQAQRRFDAFLALLTPDVEARRLGEEKLAWQAELDETYAGYFRARERWLAASPPPELSGAVGSLDALRETQWILRQELLGRVDDFEQALAGRDRMRARQRAFQLGSTTRRAANSGALLLFALVAILLRDRLSAAVRDAEERRARREIELAEREKEHWIALTAGLTHGLGNDILAWDVHLAEVTRLLEAPAVAAPRRALELLRWLADGNRGRLGFLQFLDAFARHRQAAAGDAPAIRFEPLDLPALIGRVRRNLAQAEIAGLPAEGSDPAVDRQIAILRDLPIEVRAEDDRARTLTRGHRGIVEFFVYELVKNALRSATGERPLVARLSRAGDRLELAIENDVQVERSVGACPRCGREGALRRVRRRRDAPPACDACFEAALQELLDQSFAPGKGSGTGLGLFLIRHFLDAFWNGEIRARVADGAVPAVEFTLALPDPVRAP